MNRAILLVVLAAVIVVVVLAAPPPSPPARSAQPEPTATETEAVWVSPLLEPTATPTRAPDLWRLAR